VSTLLSCISPLLIHPIHSNKAVADGGVSYFIDHYVSTRVAKYAYGVNISTQYDKTNEEHLKRASSIYVDVQGDVLIPKAFDVILPMVSDLQSDPLPYSGLHTYRVYRSPKPKNSVEVSSVYIKKNPMFPRNSEHQ
jgi:hypothetical protein